MNTRPEWLTEEFLLNDLKKLAIGMAYQFRKMHFAEDIYQESIMRLLEKANGYQQPRGTLKAWARVVIRTEIIPRFNRMSYDLDFTCHDFRVLPETKMQYSALFMQEKEEKERENTQQINWQDAKQLLSTLRSTLSETLSTEEIEIAVKLCFADKEELRQLISTVSLKIRKKINEELTYFKKHPIFVEWRNGMRS